MKNLPRQANACELGEVPWHLPWFDPWRDAGQRIEHDLASGLALWDALNRSSGAPVRFVPHTDLPPGIAYERFISETACCPTRAGLHDFFNGLCWINFPATKTRLNRLQAQQIVHDGIGPVRGAARDAMTLLDENGALMRAPQALWDALVAKRWHELFVNLRPLWRDARLLLFGHALLEKMVAPRKPVTAHVYRVQTAGDSVAQWDTWVAADLSGRKLASKPFAPLPVMGVPGWCAANEDGNFYNDTSVFRMPRRDGIPAQ